MMNDKDWPEPFGYFCDWGDCSYGLQRIAMYYVEPGSAGENDWNEFPKVHKNLPLYTADQVREIVKRELEACAEICELREDYMGEHTEHILERIKENFVE